MWTAACLTHNGPFSPPSPGMSDDIGKYIVIGFVLLFGALAWRAWQIRQHSPEWPYVMGEVTVSRAYSQNDFGEDVGTPSHRWQTEVQYRYEVNGIPMTGKRLRAFGRHHFTQEEAEAEIAPFPVGKQVKVYYDPAKPGTSVLIPG